LDFLAQRGAVHLDEIGPFEMLITAESDTGDHAGTAFVSDSGGKVGSGDTYTHAALNDGRVYGQITDLKRRYFLDKAPSILKTVLFSTSHKEMTEVN
jgi:hypothetical protein